MRAREQVRSRPDALPPSRLEAAAPARPRLPEADDAGTRAHRQWLAAAALRRAATELAYLDALAAVDGLVARKRRARRAALAARARGASWWPTVARLRCVPRHRHADRVRDLPRDRRLGTASSGPRSSPPGSGSCRRSTSPARAAARARSPRPAPATHAGCSSRQPGTTCASRGSARRVANRQQGQPAHVLQIAWRAQHRLYRLHTRLRAAREARRTSAPSPSPANSPASSGPPPRAD